MCLEFSKIDNELLDYLYKQYSKNMFYTIGIHPHHANEINDDYLKKLKDENLRLQNDNERLQFLFNDYLSEQKLSKNTVLSRVLESINQKKVNKSKKDFKIDRKNIKKFVEKWEKGMTTNEITQELQEESLSIKVGKRKRYNLKNRD